jgi:hypothetical protein
MGVSTSRRNFAVDLLQMQGQPIADATFAAAGSIPGIRALEAGRIDGGFKLIHDPDVPNRP